MYKALRIFLIYHFYKQCSSCTLILTPLASLKPNTQVENLIDLHPSLLFPNEYLPLILHQRSFLYSQQTDGADRKHRIAHPTKREPSNERLNVYHCKVEKTAIKEILNVH